PAFPTRALPDALPIFATSQGQGQPIFFGKTANACGSRQLLHSFDAYIVEGTYRGNVVTAGKRRTDADRAMKEPVVIEGLIGYIRSEEHTSELQSRENV